MTDQADDEVLDLTAIAQAHPARRVRLDMRAIEGGELLSVGDIVDMAAKLGTDPLQLSAVLSAGAADTPFEITLALAWVIGRKADPGLSYDEVRMSWRVEGPAPTTAEPDPTPPTPQRRARATSSG